MFLHLKNRVVKLQHVKRVSLIFENFLKLCVDFDILVAINFVLQVAATIFMGVFTIYARQGQDRTAL